MSQQQPAMQKEVRKWRMLMLSFTMKKTRHGMPDGIVRNGSYDRFIVENSETMIGGNHKDGIEDEEEKDGKVAS